MKSGQVTHPNFEQHRSDPASKRGTLVPPPTKEKPRGSGAEKGLLTISLAIRRRNRGSFLLTLAFTRQRQAHHRNLFSRVIHHSAKTARARLNAHKITPYYSRRGYVYPMLTYTIRMARVLPWQAREYHDKQSSPTNHSMKLGVFCMEEKENGASPIPTNALL